MNKNKFVFDSRHEKELSGFSLLKYEIFINLFPGAFFGETALENTSKKRNASIRTEEDCIILSLNNETYGNLISDDSKKIKSLDVSFICNNFFFGNISPILFNKYYFPFFKAITKKKGEILYQQGGEMTSIFLLKEGEVKFELFCSVLDVYNLIKSLVYAIEKNNHLFKINEKEIKNIKDTYLNDSFYFNLRNKNDAFNEQLKLKKKILVYTCQTFEIFGLIEYFLETNYNTTCYVNSLGCKLMEIQNYDLEKIINGEKLILTPYYQTVFNKIFSQIKRLNNIKEDYIKQFEFKIREKVYDENISMNYFIKGQVGISKPYVKEKIKIKPLYSDNNNSVSYKKDSDTKISKNFDKNKNTRSSYVNNIPLINNDKVRKNKEYNLFIKTNNFSDNNQTKKKYKSKDNKKIKMHNINIVKEDNKMPTLYSNKNNESSIKSKRSDPASNTIVNCGRKFLSLKQIKKKIRNNAHDIYDFNNFRTNEEKSPKKDENKEIIHTSFTKNDFGLSQSNFRYDLLSTGSKFKIFSKEKFNPYISYGSFGINIKKLGPNTSPTLSDRVSFWKNKQIHNFEEIKKFNARKKLMNTMFVNPIETKMRGSSNFINKQNLYNNTFLLSQTRNLRDY
jgi:CRP-like cAMP-binding protein